MSSWARKTKQTTAVPRDLPARRGGDDGREVDGNSGDGGVREWADLARGKGRGALGFGKGGKRARASS